MSTSVGAVLQFPSIDTKQKSIKKIKEEIDLLEDIEVLLEGLTSSYKLSGLEQLFHKATAKEKKQINKILSELVFLINDMRKKQMIHDHMEAMASYLARLKVTMITKDADVGKKIMKKFLMQKNTRLSQLLDEIEQFNKQVVLLDEVFGSFSDVLHKVAGRLETKMTLERQEQLKQLHTIALKQKELVYHIGQQFVSIAKALLQDKQYRQSLKKAS